MMTSSNGNIFRVTGPLCGEFTGHRWILLTKASDAELGVFFDLRLNKRLSKQSWGWWFETLSHPLWRYCNGYCISMLKNSCLAWVHGNHCRMAVTEGTVSMLLILGGLLHNRKVWRFIVIWDPVEMKESFYCPYKKKTFKSIWIPS